jgi:hypothetical protein
MKKLGKLKLHELDKSMLVLEPEYVKRIKGGESPGFSESYPYMLPEVVVTASRDEPNDYYKYWYWGPGSAIPGRSNVISGYDTNYAYGGILDQVINGWLYDYSALGSNGAGGYTSSCGTIESQSASRIIANSNVTLASVHVDPRGEGDNASAAQNLADASNGLQVHTSVYGDAQGQEVSLSYALLCGIENLGQSFKFSISEIAGGDHAANSSHYSGNSMDVNLVNGIRVNLMSEADINAFRDAVFATGAKVVYDPYHDPYGGHSNHFHIQW